MTDQPLPPNQQRVRAGHWPLVGERGPRNDAAPWSLAIAGCVRQPKTISLDELRAMPQVTRRIDVHCVTRWSKPAMEFSGVPLCDLLERNTLPMWTSEAKFVSFVARSDRNHSTSLPLHETLQLDPLIVLQAEGQPLATEHGGPLRVVVPGKYFYKSVKWIERIELLPQERLGYWESEAGYHNGADPWQEQRYMASTLSKQAALRVIATRDFSQRDLRGINAAYRDLANLNADHALLRDANFQAANLQHANFRNANLSNAKLQSADLREACLVDADLEGADLSGADLRGCDLRGASLFGASFREFHVDDSRSKIAMIDARTRIDLPALDALVDEQKTCMLAALKSAQMTNDK